MSRRNARETLIGVRLNRFEVEILEFAGRELNTETRQQTLRAILRAWPQSQESAVLHQPVEETNGA